FFNKGKERILKQWIEGGSAKTLKIMLMDPAYTPDIDAHEYVSDISASRATGTTDQTLANVTATVDDTNDRAEVDADDVDQTGQTTSTDKAVVYEDTGSDATST